MTLSARALTTVATVLDELGMKPGDVDVKRRLERLIEAASAFVVTRCGRELVCEAGIVEKLRGRGSVRLVLARRPVVSIASIVVDDVAVDASEYSIENADAGEVFRRAGWAWSAQMQPGLSYHRAPRTEEPNIVATYTGGFVTPNQVELGAFATRTLPADLEDIVVRLVVSRWHGMGTDQRVKSEAVMSASVTYSSSALSDDDAAVLARYTPIGSA